MYGFSDLFFIYKKALTFLKNLQCNRHHILFIPRCLELGFANQTFLLNTIIWPFYKVYIRENYIFPAVDKPKAAKNCEEPIAHYLELGCRPVHSKRSGKCPERYVCPFMERSIDPKKCFYK